MLSDLAMEDQKKLKRAISDMKPLKNMQQIFKGKGLRTSASQEEDRQKKVAEKEADKQEEYRRRLIHPIGGGSSRVNSRNARQSVALKDAPLLTLLAQYGFNDADIFEGDPALFPALHQFKDVLASIESLQDTVVTFVFPDTPEFVAMKRKAYKVDKNQPIHQVLTLICRKLQVTGRKFLLSTIRGFILNDEDSLHAYGLGTLFSNWELLLIPKKEDFRPTFSMSSEPECTVTFSLPLLVEFQGLKSKVMKVDVKSTVQQLIMNICEKFKVKNAESFVLCTDFVSSHKQHIVSRSSHSTGTKAQDIILDPDSDLASYGLGKRFTTWNLKLTFRNIAHLPDDVMPSESEFKWTQIEESNLFLGESREIIKRLDLEYFNYKSQTDYLEASQLILKKKVELLEATCTVNKSEISHLSNVNIGQRETIQSLQKEKEELKSQLEAERSASLKLSNQLRDAGAENEESKQQMAVLAEMYNEDRAALRLKISELTSALDLRTGERDLLAGEMQLLIDDFNTVTEDRDALDVELAKMRQDKRKEEERLGNALLTLAGIKDAAVAEVQRLKEELHKSERHGVEVERQLGFEKEERVAAEVRNVAIVEYFDIKMNDLNNKFQKVNARNQELESKIFVSSVSAKETSDLQKLALTANEKATALEKQRDQLTLLAEETKQKFEAERKDLHKELANLKEQLAKSASEREELRWQFNNKDDIRKEYMDQLNQAHASREELLSSKALVQEEATKAKQEFTELAREFQKLKKLHDHLEQSLKVKSAERDQFAKEKMQALQDAEVKEENYRHQIADVEHRVEIANQTLSRESSKLKDSLALVESQLATRSEERTKLQHDIQEQAKMYEDRLGQLKEEIRKLTAPPPAPAPPPVKASNGVMGTGQPSDKTLLRQKGSLQKPPDRAPQQYNDIAAHLYQQLQTRFTKVRDGEDLDVEDLDDETWMA